MNENQATTTVAKSSKRGTKPRIMRASNIAEKQVSATILPTDQPVPCIPLGIVPKALLMTDGRLDTSKFEEEDWDDLIPALLDSNWKLVGAILHRVALELTIQPTFKFR